MFFKASFVCIFSSPDFLCEYFILPFSFMTLFFFTFLFVFRIWYMMVRVQSYMGHIFFVFRIWYIFFSPYIHELIVTNI